MNLWCVLHLGFQEDGNVKNEVEEVEKALGDLKDDDSSSMDVKELRRRLKTILLKREKGEECDDILDVAVQRCAPLEYKKGMFVLIKVRKLY